MQRRGIELRRTPGSASSALASQAKARRGPSRANVDRLDAEAVAADQKAPACGVPQRKAEHAVQLMDEVVAVLLVDVEDRLRCPTPS